MNNMVNKFEDIEKKIENLDKKFQIIENKLNNLINISAKNKNFIEKLLKKRKASRRIQDYQLDKDAQWETIKINLHKTGIILEHEVFDKLKKINIDYEPNNSYYYPNEIGKFYNDNFFSTNTIFHSFPNAEIITRKKFESDIIIHEIDKIQNELFEIFLNYYYIIECKSQSHPPVNYLIIPEIIERYIKEYDIKSVMKLYGTAFLRNLDIFSKIWRSNGKIIPIELEYLDIDKRNSPLQKGFWQLFKRIDYESSFNPDFNFFNYSYFSDIKLNSEIELPKYCSVYNDFMNKMKREKAIPKELLEKIRLNLSIFIPIIIVNGNIYTIDPLAEDNFNKIRKRIPAFIKNFNYLELDIQWKGYNHLIRFLMDTMKSEEICFTNDLFFPDIFEPILDVLIISSSEFSNVFTYIRDLVKKVFHKNVDKLLVGSFKKEKDKLIDFQIFSWLLTKSKLLNQDFYQTAYNRFIGKN